MTGWSKIFKNEAITMNATMKQQLMTEPKKITFRTGPVPKLGPDQVLVKIKKMELKELY